MKREDKNIIIESLAEKLEEYSTIYLTDIADLNAIDTNQLRRKLFKQDIQLVVVKNTLLKKAFDKSEKDFSEMESVLKGHTAVMFSNVGNAPAKVIKEFRKSSKKPLVKAAYVEESIYIGDENLEALVSIKSKDELIADVIALLQSPMNNVLSAINGGNKIAGLLETLSNKES
jgi:large subunit ribosomal protein L10